MKSGGKNSDRKEFFYEDLIEEEVVVLMGFEFQKFPCFFSL